MKKYVYNIALDDDKAPAKILRLVEENKTVLEIGCASGTQTKILKEHLHCKVTGVEIDADAAEAARAYCERVLVGSIESLALLEQLAGDQHDIILFADVLEHLYSPGKVLENIKPLLKSDGYILASIPNVVHESIVLQMINGRFDYRQYGLLDNTHIRFFTRKTIYQLFEQAGFIISHMDRVICSNCDTEFNTLSYSENDQEILKLIRERNPDSETFQFIIKAHKAPVGAYANHANLIAAQEEISDLKKALKDKDQQNKHLESSLEWLQSRLPIKLFSFLRRSSSK